MACGWHLSWGGAGGSVSGLVESELLAGRQYQNQLIPARYLRIASCCMWGIPHFMLALGPGTLKKYPSTKKGMDFRISLLLIQKMTPIRHPSLKSQRCLVPQTIGITFVVCSSFHRNLRSLLHCLPDAVPCYCKVSPSHFYLSRTRLLHQNFHVKTPFCLR